MECIQLATLNINNNFDFDSTIIFLKKTLNWIESIAQFEIIKFRIKIIGAPIIKLSLCGDIFDRKYDVF